MINKQESHSNFWKAIINKAPYAEIKKMIEEGADLNEIGTDEDMVDDYDLHEVFYACYVHPDCIKLMKLFIKNGYDYKKIASNGLNAVSNSVEYSDSRLFFYLYSLDQNLMFNPVKNGISILHKCIGSGDFKVLQFLMEKGADLKAEYEIPLVLPAVFNKDIRFIKYLIEDCNLPYKGDNLYMNKNLMMVAAECASNFEVIDYLVSKGFSVNDVSAEGTPVFFGTALNSHTEMIDYFLKLGANLNKTDFMGDDILSYASLFTSYSEAIKFLINKGFSVRKIYKKGKTLAHYAAFNPQPQIMQTLIDYGVAFDKEDSIDNNTPLELAAWYGSEDICEVLIKAGSNLEHKDKSGCTALLLSTKNKNPDVFRFLLKNGANIKAKDYLKQDVFHYVVGCSSLELVKEIEELTKIKIDNSNADNYVKHINIYNKSLEVRNDKGIPSQNRKNEKLPYLFYAAINPDIRVLGYLIGKGLNPFVGFYDENIFTQALSQNPNPYMINYLYRNKIPSEAFEIVSNNVCKNSNIEVIKRVIELGFSIDFQDSNGITLLMNVLNENEAPNPEIVSFLATEKTVNKKTELGLTASHVAVDKFDPIYLKILLEKGAKINEKDNYGITPLMLAVCKNTNLDVIDFLIKNGADISERDPEGNDALLWALSNPNNSVIELLIKYGADIHTKNRSGENLLISAIKLGVNLEKVELLVSLGIDVNEMDNLRNPAIVYSAFYNPYPEVLDFLVKKGANLRYLTDKKENLLIFAARNNPNENVVEYLLNRGFDKNYVTLEGETPVLAAAQNSNFYILEKLIKRGANLQAVNNFKHNVLFIASKCNDKPYNIFYLIEKGIPVNYKDENGNTAVLFAAQNKNINIIKTLVEHGADLNSVNNYGVTTLMAALYVDNNTEMIKYLIENGVDVNAKNSDNASAIMMAAASVTDPDIIELFITAGADLSDEDDNGYNAYKIANEYNPNPAIAELIRKYSLMSLPKVSLFNFPTSKDIN